MSLDAHLIKMKCNDGTYIDVNIKGITAEMADFWHENIQPHETSKVSANWNWPKLLWRVAIWEQFRNRHWSGLAICTESVHGNQVPIAFMIVSRGFPHIWDGIQKGYSKGLWVWFIHKAPERALLQLGVKKDIKALRNCIDLATVESRLDGTHGRIMLNSSPLGGAELESKYAHIMGKDTKFDYGWTTYLRLMRRIGALFAFNQFTSERFLRNNRGL